MVGGEVAPCREAHRGHRRRRWTCLDPFGTYPDPASVRALAAVVDEGGVAIATARLTAVSRWVVTASSAARRPYTTTSRPIRGGLRTSASTPGVPSRRLVETDRAVRDRAQLTRHRPNSVVEHTKEPRRPRVECESLKADAATH